MKIVLSSLPKEGSAINWVTAKYFKPDDSRYMPLGLLSLATNIPQNHDIKVLDPHSRNWSIDRTVEEIEKLEDVKVKKEGLVLEKSNEKKYREVVKNIFKRIGEIDDSLKLYIDDVLDKAKIVKGSKLYEQGVSIERAAELLGISQWELMSYVGKTKIIDRYKEQVTPTTARMRFAKKYLEYETYE